MMFIKFKALSGRIARIFPMSANGYLCITQVIIIYPGRFFYSAFFNPSHFTTHEPSLGKPGALPAGAPSQPAVIMAIA